MAKKKNVTDGLEPKYIEEVMGMSPDEINNRIAETAKLMVAKQQQMAEDPDVKQAKDKLKELTEDFREEINGAKKRLAYMTHRLNELGKL